MLCFFFFGSNLRLNVQGLHFDVLHMLRCSLVFFFLLKPLAQQFTSSPLRCCLFWCSSTASIYPVGVCLTACVKCPPIRNSHLCCGVVLVFFFLARTFGSSCKVCISMLPVCLPVPLECCVVVLCFFFWLKASAQFTRSPVRCYLFWCCSTASICSVDVCLTVCVKSSNSEFSPLCCGVVYVFFLARTIGSIYTVSPFCVCLSF